MRTAEREAAFAAIDSERDYQAAKWGEKAHEVDSFALYIVGYSNMLTALASTSGDTKAKLDMVRKIGGLAVACMEQHGAPKREAI